MSPSQAAPVPVRTDIKARPVRLRKGTHSCWQCKRRKMKCVFGPEAAACHGCRARGSRCFTQEYPEDAAGTLEAMVRVHGRADGIGESSATSSAGASATDRSNIPRSVASDSPPHEADDDCESLSHRLCRSLPSRIDTEKIYNALPYRPSLVHEMITMPYTYLSPDCRDQAKHQIDTPDSWMHPVLIARHMLLLASLLQHLPSKARAELESLSETPQAISARLADHAIRCITTKDEMLGSIEGLECIMIESVYHANLGNLQRSWVAGRRALSVAQLIGLGWSDDRAQYDVLDPRIPHNACSMWSRLVFMDRFLCLMLGVPQGCTDSSMSPEAILTSDVPMERLERIHCAVACRILERNKIEPSEQYLILTKALDRELQMASRSITSKWWLIPKLDSARMEPHTVLSNTGRLFAQVLHYNLLNQLHLPYMLRFSVPSWKPEYSIITCVNASRDILSRFVALREFNGIATSCRITDFIALMASITLVLAHLDSQFSGNNLLAHQYHSDRAMIEQVQDNFREINDHSSEGLSAKSASLLRRLIDIEVEAGQDFHRSIRRISVHRVGTEAMGMNHEGAESVYIPYFGIIRIAHHETPASHVIARGMTGTSSLPAYSQAVSAFAENGTLSTQLAHQTHSSMPTNRQSLANSQSMALAIPGSTHPDMNSRQMPAMTQALPNTYAAPGSTRGPNFTPQQRQDSANSFISIEDSFGLGTGTGDWAFQGADMAFLEDFSDLQRVM